MVKKNNRNDGDVKPFQKINRYRIAVEKWTIDIASLWKLTIVEVYTVAIEKQNIGHNKHLATFVIEKRNRKHNKHLVTITTEKQNRESNKHQEKRRYITSWDNTSSCSFIHDT